MGEVVGLVLKSSSSELLSGGGLRKSKSSSSWGRKKHSAIFIDLNTKQGKELQQRFRAKNNSFTSYSHVTDYVLRKIKHVLMKSFLFTLGLIFNVALQYVHVNPFEENTCAYVLMALVKYILFKVKQNLESDIVT